MLLPRVAFVLMLGLAGAESQADVPLPPRLLNPRSVPEAWNVIRLATDNVERLLVEKRVDEVTDQIVLCSAALRLLAAHGLPAEKKAAADAGSAEAFSLVNLVARESMAGNAQAAASAFSRLRAVLTGLGEAFGTDWTRLEVFACPDHPESVSEEAGRHCSHCLRTMTPRRIPYSFVYVQPGRPEMRVAATAEGPLQAGEEARVTLRLEKEDGQPAVADDLLVNHTASVHLLLCDETLRHFQHLTAVPDAEAGVFAASLTPATGAGCHLWTALVPAASGLAEFHRAFLPGSAPAETAVTWDGPRTEVEEGGFRFQLSFHQAARPVAGRTQLMRIHVTEAAGGAPVNRLEPFRNAFAHITGVYTDLETVLQLHPAGGDILREDLRGGPYLAFKFFAPRPGPLRLFCEVQIDGRRIIVPLAVEVAR